MSRKSCIPCLTTLFHEFQQQPSARFFSRRLLADDLGEPLALLVAQHGLSSRKLKAALDKSLPADSAPAEKISPTVLLENP